MALIWIHEGSVMGKFEVLSFNRLIKSISYVIGERYPLLILQAHTYKLMRLPIVTFSINAEKLFD